MSVLDGTIVECRARTRRFTDHSGFFCDVAFFIRSLDTDDRRLEAAEVPPQFRGALVFGIDYALGKLGYFGGWHATLEHFESHAIDTTPEVVALTTAQAVLRACGSDMQPILDAERGMTMFPK